MELKLNTTGTAPEVRTALQNEFKRQASQNPAQAAALAGLRDYTAAQVGAGDGTDGQQYQVVADITLSVVRITAQEKAAEAQGIRAALEAVANQRSMAAGAGVTGTVPVAAAAVPPGVVPSAPKA